MTNLADKTTRSRFVAAILTLLLTLSLGMALPVGNAYAEPQTSTESNTGDIHDDRPDDASGGDSSTATTSISEEARGWAAANGFDLSAFENYKAPAAHEPSAEDIEAFKNWMTGGSNPRNQVMQQAQSVAGESIANELWNYCNTIWKGWMNTANVGSVVSQASGLKNVGAMQEGMFAGYFGSLLGGNGSNGYSSAATLIKDGFVVSSDGVTYRLHNLSDGSIAYEMAAPESATVSVDKFPEGLTSFTDFFPLTTQEATDEAKRLLAEYSAVEKTSEPSGVDREVYQAAAQYVNDTFGEYFGQCPGPTVVKGIIALGISLDAATEDTVGSSVGEREFVSSFFGVESAAASLWRLGYLPSFDGTTYRLHSGKDGTVVFSATASELQEYLASAQDSVSIPYVLYIGLGVAGIAIVGLAIFVIRRRKTSK